MNVLKITFLFFLTTAPFLHANAQKAQIHVNYITLNQYTSASHEPWCGNGKQLKSDMQKHSDGRSFKAIIPQRISSHKFPGADTKNAPEFRKRVKPARESKRTEQNIDCFLLECEPERIYQDMANWTSGASSLKRFLY